MKCRPVCSFCGVTSRRHDFVIISPVYKEWVEKTLHRFFRWAHFLKAGLFHGGMGFSTPESVSGDKDRLYSLDKSDEKPRLWMFYDVSEMRCSVSSVRSSSRAGVTPRREEEWARVFPSFSHIQIDQQRSKVWLGLWIKSCTCSRKIWNYAQSANKTFALFFKVALNTLNAWIWAKYSPDSYLGSYTLVLQALSGFTSV